MDGKIRILFYNLDGAGVNYFRTLTPAMEIERNHSDEFYVEINPQINFNDPAFVDYLKTFHIIHYHRQFLGDSKQMLNLANELKKSGTILMVDIDDYWNLHQKHPFYTMSLEKKLYIPILENLKIADYVTTTTDLFADEIRKVTGKDNVGVFYNSVDPVWMKQFQNNWKPDPDGRVRIIYMAGSSHMADVEQLQGVMNVLSNDSNLKDKFKVIIAGWDTEGNTTDITFNQEFGTELQKRGLWVHKMVKDINKSRGDVDKISNLPIDLKEKYRGKIFNTQQRDIKSTESVYYIYEKILTNNHRMISNPDYIQWLFNFERNVEYPEEGNFARRWTQKANTYAKVLDETDIVIAPLADNSFNKMKCVTENTLISTDYGIFKIGDIVNNSHWQIMKIFNENIINVFKYPNENVVKLITENGYEIEGTETHKILIDNKWMMLGNVNVGDDIEITRFEFESKEYQRIHYPLLLSKRVTDNVINKACKGMIPSIEINEFYGRFFGYMLGDGHFSKGYLNITCDKRYEDVVDDIKTLVEYMGLVPIIYDKKPDKRCKNSLAKEGFGLEIRIPSKHLAEICCRENLRNEKGKVFEVPHFILKSPKSVIREFLRGLFEADGMVSVEGSYVSFTTKSENFAKQIQYLLLGFNIVSKITYSYNKIYNRYYYNIRLNRAASDLFYQEIGFISKIKSSKLKLVSEKKHSNRYSDQVWTSKVVEVKRDVKDVYDVEVEKIHIYNGNGIINHNSNLKQVECWSRKLPIVCSDIPPYNVHGRHMENCVLIPAVKNAHKYWTKYLKKLIINPDLRKQLGEQLYEDFKDQYNLANVTKKRADFYRAAVAKTLAVV
jgi:intein/homing endonuclease